MINFPLTPYDHQFKAYDFTEDRPFYALLMEQGTGKSPVVIWDCARRHLKGQLDGALICAPNGVQHNWVLRMLPQHMPKDVNYYATAWYSGMNKRDTEQMRGLFAPETRDRLRVLAMNWEALNTEDGFETACQFMRSLSIGKRGLFGDESQRFKNPAAKRTKALMKLEPLADAVKGILSGTPIVKSPWDAFSQFFFLSKLILGTTSYIAFKAEYAELLPPGHGLLRHITDRLRPEVEKRFASIKEFAMSLQDEEMRKLELNRFETLVHEALAKRAPQLVARDPITNLPKWRNMEKLDALIAPHSFRVLKKDCLDLPEKVYDTIWFQQTPKQQNVYDKLKEEFRLELENGDILPVQRLGALTKLSQVTSGYFLVPGTDIQQRIMPLERNPKIDVLIEELETCLEAGEQVIIWAHFQAELKDIAQVLDEHHWSYAEYHGEIGSKTARQEAIDQFEAGKKQVFLSQQQAGGTGLTLIAPNSVAAQMTVIYYSNTWSLEDRLQSEDRAHRIGQSKTVRYIDIAARNTIDGAVQESLRAKADIAAIVTGDARRAAMALGLVH